MTLYAVVLVRGRTQTSRRLKDALDSIRLTRVNHCSLVEERNAGVFRVCKDYITWGEVDEDTLAKLIKKRGRMLGDKLVDSAVLNKGGFESASAFAKALFEGKAKLDAFGMKKLFRLHPPRGGHRHIKVSYPRGALGYRKEKINELLRLMM